eukprot:7391570-Prymnesium_polylepis.6
MYQMYAAPRLVLELKVNILDRWPAALTSSTTARRHTCPPRRMRDSVLWRQQDNCVLRHRKRPPFGSQSVARWLVKAGGALENPLHWMITTLKGGTALLLQILQTATSRRAELNLEHPMLALDYADIG